MTGYFAALSLAIFLSAKDLVSKNLSLSLSGTLSAFASFFYALPFYAALLIVLWLLGYETFAVTSTFAVLICVRAMTDTGAEWTKMSSLTYADISLVAAFQSLSSTFLVLFSPLITGDPLSSTSALGLVVITIAGICLPRPWQKSERARAQLRGVLLSILSAFFFSLNHCVDRLAAQTGSAALSAASMTFLSGAFLLPIVLLRERTPRRDLAGASKPLLIRGLLEVIMMVSKLLALQHLSAPQTVAIARLAIPLSIIGGALFYKERDIAWRLAFGSLMVCGSILTVFG